MLEARNISLNLGNFSLSNINLTIDKGEYFVLLGLSGVGKSLFLETIAGLRNPSNGSIFLRGNELSTIPIQKRNISIVYQDLVLFPHMNVFDNIAYPLKASKAKEIKRIVERVAQQTEISDKLNRMPETLSGGEAQRVALARSLAAGSDIFLLDEPLSSIDLKLKNDLRALLRKLNREGITIIHVTHDYEEALSLASQIGIMENGKLVQVDTPEEIFRHPKSEFVAHFTGIKNFLKGTVVSDTETDTKMFRTYGTEIKCLSEITEGNAFLMIDPEDIVLSGNTLFGSMRNSFKGIIVDIVPARFGLDIHIDTGITFIARITREASASLQIKIGKEVWVHFKASSCKVYN